jgi:sugar lactone lactonase YvrE
MKTNLTEAKLRSGIRLTRHLISGVLCLAVITLICARASAQNLFATDYLSIDEFTPNGVQSTFASGLNNPLGLAFDKAANLFVTDTGTHSGEGAVYKFTPTGVRTTFASGLNFPRALAFDSQGNLFVTVDDVTIYKFTPSGARTTFATGLPGAYGLAFDRAGNLFVAAGYSFVSKDKYGTVYKFTPTGVRTTFASGLNTPLALAFDSQGNLFVADQGYGYDFLYDPAVYKFTPSGLRSTVASVIPAGLAIDGADNLFVSDYRGSGNLLKFTPSGVRTIFAAGSYVTAIAFQPSQAPTPTLLNISGRGDVQTGDNVLISGFTVSSIAEGHVTSTPVVIRGLGPGLGNFGVLDALQDPVLGLLNDASMVSGNDNWQSAGNARQIPINYQPPDVRESVIMTTLPPGAYTAVLSGKNATTGNGLVEVYSTVSGLSNASIRGFVGTGDHVLIGGFSSSGGNGSIQLVIRALGPTLSQFAVNSALADPTLILVNGNGSIIASNDNWKNTQQNVIQSTGFAPPNDLESAIFATLSNGNYTAIVAGKNGGTGVGLLDVYRVSVATNK